MDYLQQMLAVLAVFGALGGTLFWLRRRGLASFAMPFKRKNSLGLQGVLTHVERLPLSATHSLHLVRLADRAILIAAWQGGCQAIESTPWSQVEQTSSRSAQ